MRAVCLRFRTECGIVGIVLDAKLRLVTWFLLKSLEGRKREGVVGKRRRLTERGGIHHVIAKPPSNNQNPGKVLEFISSIFLWTGIFV